MNTTYWVLAVEPKLPVKTMAEFVAYTKAHPGTVNFAAGSSLGLSMGTTTTKLTATALTRLS